MLVNSKSYAQKIAPPFWRLWARKFADHFNHKRASNTGDDASLPKWAEEAPQWLLEDIGMGVNGQSGGEETEQTALQKASSRAQRRIG